MDLDLINEVYKAAINNANDIVLLISESGKIIRANKEAVKTYGYSMEELLSMTIFDLRNKERLDYVNKQFNIAKSIGIEFKALHYKKDNSSFPVEVKSVGVETKSDKYVVSIIRDITYRMKNEEEIRHLAAIVENSSEAIIAKDLQCNITSWNKGAEKIYGYSKEEAIGKHISLIIPQERIKELNEFINSIVDGKEVKNYETNRKNKKGEILAVSVSLSPIYDFDGNLIGVSNITRDITEMKLKEKELKRNYDELTSIYEELTATEEELRANCIELEDARIKADKANQAKDEFLANMSHEIRTPMNGITGLIELLSLTELSDEQKEYIQMVKSSSNMLLDIVNNLLDISKIESKKFDLNIQEFNIKNTLDRIIKEFSFICKIKNLEFFYYIDPLIPYDILGDELRLNQVIINIMNNAVKFTEKGRIVLKVTRISQKNGKVYIKFEVNDTGMGIKEEFKSNIFKKFVQQDISYTKKFAGTGLGLAISKELIKQMNGEIWFESQFGVGSTFCFSAEFLINSKKCHEDLEAVTTLDVSDKTNKTILIVEDNNINMMIASEMIKKLGFKYICAYNGNEALEVLKENVPDIILMDIQMPILNGLETTKIIRRNEVNQNRHIPIIAMTAYAMIGDMELCINSGMDDYISKPFNINRLKEVININI